MDAPSVGPKARYVEENLAKATTPFQTAWRRIYFELPFTFVAEAMRFAGQRLQAQGDFLASLESCKTVPEVIDAQSRFVRAAVGDYGSETSKIVDDVRNGVSKAA